MADIIDDLRNPMWVHSNAPFESPQLEKEENLAAMNAAADEIERLQKIRLIAEDVVWYDWSNNDSDAVHTMDQLRLALAALSPAETKSP